ncbi:PDR/VanB family oxidoreductase [soil metagenome]
MTVHGLAEFDVTVTAIVPIAADILLITLARSDGGELPEWAPGAHIDVVLSPGVERQYSLCSDPADNRSWQVAVLREPSGRGGSEFLHTALSVGHRLRARGPLNHFAFEHSERYVFIAGGIGITPLLPMIRAADTAGADWTLAYAGRSEGAMAFARELRAEHPERVVVYASDVGERLALDAIFDDVSASTLVYCCGPARLLDAALGLAHDWPAGRLRLERFEAREVGAPVLDDSFEVELELSGLTLTVPPEKTILEVVEDAGVLVLSSCREGTCGTCETPVVSGEVDHRDSVLTPEEQADNEVMMICVSRAACPRLVLEL